MNSRIDQLVYYTTLRDRLVLSLEDGSNAFHGAKPEIKKVIFNDPATIVIWSDDSKTVVKCENEAYDPEKGLAMAISKRVLGNKGNYYETFKKWLPKEEEKTHSGPVPFHKCIDCKYRSVEIKADPCYKCFGTGDKPGFMLKEDDLK